eukprot:m51a1_g10067 hypothetical protein (410) ;mRNA; f:394-3294
MLERPGAGVMELQAQPAAIVPSLASGIAVSLAAHTSSTVVLATSIIHHIVPVFLGRKSVASTSLYLYDVHTGELFNSLSFRGCMPSLNCCYHEASHVLGILRELASEQSTEPADTASALCTLLQLHAPLQRPSPDKGSLWQRIWELRGLWRPLLPSAPGAELRATWLQEVSLCLALGMHSRVGDASPLQLLSPILAREIVCSYLTPPAAFVALYCSAPTAWNPYNATLKVMLQRPNLGVTELPACQSGHVEVAVAAHTDDVVLLAVSTDRSTSLYLYDAHSGKRLNTLSFAGFKTALNCCYHEASQRLAVAISLCDDDEPRRRSEASGVSLTDSMSEAVGLCRKLTFTLQQSEDGHVWLTCYDVIAGNVVHRWRLCEDRSTAAGQGVVSVHGTPQISCRRSTAFASFRP